VTTAEHADRHRTRPPAGHSEYHRNLLLTQAFRDHAAAVFGVARRVGGQNNASDVTQEVFLRLWAHPERFDPARGPLRSYLCTVARGVAIDFTRQERARMARDGRSTLVGLVPEVDPEHVVIRDDDARRVNRALGQLEVDERTAIVEAFTHDISYRQAADRLRLPEGTVKSRIRLGLRKLRDDLQQ
jgi:RNA polymerase sigma-70 factor, ECF subfamily